MSFWEIMIILLVALLVIKPERFPEIAYTLGKLFRKIHIFYQSFTHKYRSFLE